MKKYESMNRLQEQFSMEGLVEELKREYGAKIGEKKEVYIWGTGLLGKFAHKQFTKSEWRVTAFIDNNTALAGKMIDGIPVIRPDMAEPSRLIVICTKFFPDIEKQIENTLSNPYIYYGILSVIYDEFEIWDMALEGMLEKLDTYRANYIRLFDKYADEISGCVLDAILNYRFTMKAAWLNRAYEETSVRSWGGAEEYFDTEIIKLRNDEVFADCGGYTGDTVLRFAECAGNKYKKIYYIEPNNVIYQKGKENINGLQGVVSIQAGVGEEEGIMKFSGAEDYGHIDDSGTESIKIVALDEVIDERPTFIKMDIEGAELSALKGAAQIIKTNSPKLAICVYHKPEDLFEIMELIDSWGLHYKYYLRHYTREIRGTILYCIPQADGE